MLFDSFFSDGFFESLEIDFVQRSFFLSFDLTFDSLLFGQIFTCANSGVVELFFVGFLDDWLDVDFFGEENYGLRNFVISRNLNSLEIGTSRFVHNLSNRLDDCFISNGLVESSDEDNILFFEWLRNWRDSGLDLTVPDILIVKTLDSLFSLVSITVYNLSIVGNRVLRRLILNSEHKNSSKFGQFFPDRNNIILSN